MCSKLVVVTLLLSTTAFLSSYAQEDGFICTRATFYGSPECSANPRGACGFGEYGTTVNNGLVSGVSRLYRNGTGCGACYQVRCRIPTLCSDEGIKLVVTDYGAGGHGSDFILNVRAYANLARPNMAEELFGYGVVDVEYKQIPCQYGSNLMVKVHEHSKNPHYLAIFALYQGGDYDITCAEVWVEDCKEWRPMRKPFGAVWDLENPPMGALKLRFQVTAVTRGETKSIEIPNAIPADWKPGVAYDTSLQLN